MPNPVRTLCVALCGVAALSAAPARAALIDVQFSGNFSFYCPGGGTACSNPAQTGAAVVGSAGDVWNDFAAASAGATPLQTAAGTGSGISIGFSSQLAYYDGTNGNAFAGTPYANLMSGYLVSSPGNTISIGLSGLGAGQAFSLYLYDQADGGGTGRGGIATVNGVSQTMVNGSSPGRFVPGDNYLLFSGTADALGNIGISFGSASNETDLNGLQLLTTAVAIPEPASLALLGMGMAGMAAVRRRAQAGAGRPGSRR